MVLIILAMLNHLLIEWSVLAFDRGNRLDKFAILRFNLDALVLPLNVIQTTWSSLVEPSLASGTVLFYLEKHSEVFLRQLFFFQFPC